MTDGIINTPSGLWNITGGWFFGDVGYFDWDWSRDAFVDEPDWVHNWSKGAGGIGLTAAGGALTQASRAAQLGGAGRLLPGVGAAERTWGGTQLNWVAKELDIDRRRLGDAIEKIKRACGRGGPDNVQIGVQTGNVYDDAGELLGNVFDEIVY